MNPKYEKVCKEIEKIRAKMTEYQAKLRELERQKTELENCDIVAAFRSTNISPQELAEYIKAFQQHGAAAVPGAAQSGASAVPTSPYIPKQEDKDIEE